MKRKEYNFFMRFYHDDRKRIELVVNKVKERYPSVKVVQESPISMSTNFTIPVESIEIRFLFSSEDLGKVYSDNEVIEIYVKNASDQLGTFEPIKPGDTSYYNPIRC